MEGGVDALECYDIELDCSACQHLLLREWPLPSCVSAFWLVMAADETNAKLVPPVATNLATYRLLLIAPNAGKGQFWLAALGYDWLLDKLLLGRRHCSGTWLPSTW